MEESKSDAAHEENYYSVQPSVLEPSVAPSRAPEDEAKKSGKKTAAGAGGLPLPYEFERESAITSRTSSSCK